MSASRRISWSYFLAGWSEADLNQALVLLRLVLLMLLVFVNCCLRFYVVAWL